MTSCSSQSMTMLLQPRSRTASRDPGRIHCFPDSPFQAPPVGIHLRKLPRNTPPILHFHDLLLNLKEGTYQPRMAAHLVVNEIFHSIQGESCHSGRPCVFVRLTYCNLRCSYCDTEYAFHEGVRMDVQEIIRRVRAYQCPLVEVTGGEPLVQRHSPELLQSLCDEGFEVLLETGGSLDISKVDPRVKRIVDFKCPGSGMEEHNLWSNVDCLSARDEVKFVIGDRDDFDWSVEKVRLHDLEDRCSVLFSVVFGVLPPVHLAEWILEKKLRVRLQLQMHKYLWQPEARGV